MIMNLTKYFINFIGKIIKNMFITKKLGENAKSNQIFHEFNCEKN